jgi:lysophospholipase L1-like esterase
LKIKQLTTNLFLTLAAILLSLLIIEGGFRVYGILLALGHEKILAPSHIPDLGHIAKANYRKPHLQTNSMHLRDAEMPLPKPENTIRIAIVGNSVTFGADVPQKALFTELLEEDLKAAAGGEAKVEIINAGQIGFNIDKFQAFSEHFVYPYQPDVIIYQFCWNDIAVASRLKGRRFPDQVPEKGLQRFLLQHSKVYLNLYRLSNRRAFAEKLIDYYKNAELVGEFYRDLFTWAEGVRNRGIHFAMTLFPMALEVEATDKYTDVARAFISQKNEIVDVIERGGIAVYDVSAAFREHYFENRQELYVDQAHLNERGHRLVADLLAPFLNQYLTIGKGANSP